MRAIVAVLVVPLLVTPVRAQAVVNVVDRWNDPRTHALVADIYWAAPSFSKQVIEGRRDTLLLPTDITYHRDHLGVVQNNFPNTIRLGDGDEVRDVPHPLSLPGLAVYDFAIVDSLRTRLPDQTIDVYKVLVRPRNARVPGIVGAIYIE